MNRRVGLVAVTLAIALLLPVLAAGAAGCSSTNSATTAAPQTNNTAAQAAATTGAVTSTSATAPAGLSSPLGRTTTTGSQHPQQYLTEIAAFGQALAELPVTDDPSNFADVSSITGAQLEAAGKYVSGVQSAVALLKGIQPPAEVAAAHEKVVAAMEALAVATDKLLTAAQNHDQAAFDAAQNEGRAAVQALQTAMGELHSLLGDTTPSS
jgi:hypothetical protein